MYLLELVKALLGVFVVLGLTTQFSISKHLYVSYVLVIMFASIFMVYQIDVVLSLLLCASAIVIISSLKSKKKSRSTFVVPPKPKEKAEFNTLNKAAKKNIQETVPVAKPLAPKELAQPVPVECELVNTPDPITNHFKTVEGKMGIIQTNVFDDLNQKVFYSELGNQYNIQGIEQDDVSGYDRSIY